MISAETPPAALCYDLELCRPLPEGEHGPRWDLAHTCGISVIAAWHSHEHEPRVYTPGFRGYEHEVQRFYDGVGLAHLVSWNGLEFDDPIIGTMLGNSSWTDGKKCVDLSILCGLFEKAAKKGLNGQDIVNACSNGVPADFPILLGYKPNARQAVRNGWPLEGTYCATFGVDKAKSMNGARAPELWQAWRYAEVIGYCVGDAWRLYRLWKHAWDGGVLRGAKGGSVVLPRAVL